MILFIVFEIIYYSFFYCPLKFLCAKHIEFASCLQNQIILKIFHIHTGVTFWFYLYLKFCREKKNRFTWWKNLRREIKDKKLLPCFFYFLKILFPLIFTQYHPFDLWYNFLLPLLLLEKNSNGVSAVHNLF